MQITVARKICHMLSSSADFCSHNSLWVGGSGLHTRQNRCAKLGASARRPREDIFYGERWQVTEQSSHFCLERTGPQTKCLVTLKHYFFQAFLILIFIWVGFGIHDIVPLFQVGREGDPLAEWCPLCASWVSLFWCSYIFLFCQGAKDENKWGRVGRRTREMGSTCNMERQRGKAIT